MAGLNLVAAQAIKPAIAASGLSFCALERAALQAKLPVRIVENPTGIAPLHAVEHFLANLQNELADQNFLLRSLELDPDENKQTGSIVGIPLPIGVTNLEALNHLAGTLNNFITGARFLLKRHGNQFWVFRTTSATEWSDEWPALQYNLAIMRLAVRRVIGAEVCPVAVALPKIPEKGQLDELLCEIPLVLSSHRFGMAFDLSSVVRQRYLPLDPKKPKVDEQLDAIGPDLAQAIAASLSKFLGSSATDRLSDRVADAFGMSPRTYRRCLAKLGTTHACLLSDVRMNLAMKMLREDSYNLTEIGMELGYRHPGDFTRFFKTRMGVTPIEFRKANRAFVS